MGHLFLHAIPVLLVAQVGHATVVGVVRDAETENPLPGVIVTLTDIDLFVTTDAVGRYAFRQVPAGPHHLTIRCIGYGTRTLHVLVPRDGELGVNVSLRPQPVPLPTVEVHGNVMIRGLERRDSTSFPDREISLAAVRNHPLLAEPDVFAALGGGAVFLRPETPSGINIRGGASDQTAYVLDGVPVFNPYHASGFSSAWNPDALSRLSLSSSAPLPSQPHALSGAIEAVSRVPRARLSAQGSISNTQARLTVDGPFGTTGVGYLISVRSGLHDVIAPQDEASYLKGGANDWLAKVEAPALGGRFRLLGCGNANTIRAAAAAAADSTGHVASRRNVFEWSSRSLGVEWRRVRSRSVVRILGWSAMGDASSAWTSPTAPIAMTGSRRDWGLLAGFEHRAAVTTIAEMHFERTRTSYRIESDSASGTPWTLGGETPLATAQLQQTRSLAHGLELDVGSSVAASRGHLNLGPHAQLRWKLGENLAVSGSYARTHQFAQSLRNPESVVGNIFPVDVYVGSGARGVPVARGDLGVIAAECQPWAGSRFVVQAYERASRGLVLVAPREGEPFSTGGFVIGSAAARGISAEAAVSSARWGLVASYGWQRVRYERGDSTYVPDHGAAHHLEGGVIFYPTPTASVRLGTTTVLGRRGTLLPGDLEWASCNLGNQGCEFVGSPHYGNEPLGGTPLPAYVRVDLGVRKHMHFEVSGRDAVLELFGTASNVLGRKNLLTYARRSSGELVGVELRAPSVLVAGLDWRF